MLSTLLVTAKTPGRLDAWTPGRLDAWTAALALATRHRERTRRERGLTEHFSAPDWLDLCAGFGFQCPWCHRAEKLSPHHKHELNAGGTNTADNLLPLCWKCHQHFHIYLMSCAPDWLAGQFELCKAFQIGEFVQYRYPDTGCTTAAIHEITEIIPPARVSQAKTAYRRAWSNFGMSHHGGLMIDGVTVVHWKQAMARMGPGDPPRFGYSLEHLVRVP